MQVTLVVPVVVVDADSSCDPVGDDCCFDCRCFWSPDPLLPTATAPMFLDDDERERVEEGRGGAVDDADDVDVAEGAAAAGTAGAAVEATSEVVAAVELCEESLRGG